MANITFRSSLTPTLPGSTTLKSFPLTNLEVDANFKALNDEIETLPTVTEMNTAITTTVNTAITNNTNIVTDNSIAMSIALG